MCASSLPGWVKLLLPLLWLGGGVALGEPAERAQSQLADRIEPVTMSPRDIRPPATPPVGERIELREGDLPFLLFLPEGWTAPTNRTRLAVHFHTADWVAIGEHLRAGYRFPIAVLLLGSGSATYRAPFTDTNRFPRLLALVAATEARRGVGEAAVQNVDVCSFSAGYGAVRELVQQPAAFARIQRIVLADSLYGGLAGGTNGSGPRVVQTDHIACWLPFARAAVRGEKTFVFTFSEIPTPSYASTGECAAALLAALGLPLESVAPGSLPAAAEPTYPLRLRADAGRLHVWGYAGREAGAHLVHPRHLADVWRAVDAAKTAD